MIARLVGSDTTITATFSRTQDIATPTMNTSAQVETLPYLSGIVKENWYVESDLPHLNIKWVIIVILRMN